MLKNPRMQWRNPWDNLGGIVKNNGAPGDGEMTVVIFKKRKSAGSVQFRSVGLMLTLGQHLEERPRRWFPSSRKGHQ